MCCAFFWLNAHPQLLLLLAFNRDEFLGRPTEPLRVWEDTEIIGGQDRVNKGTWLGLTRSGRFAFVTNFREVRFDASYVRCKLLSCTCMAGYSAVTTCSDSYVRHAAATF